MSTNGQLVFTDVDKITFKGVGNTSNAVVDTVTGKIGVGIDSPDANLHVLGNSYVSTNLELGGTLIMGTVNVSAHHSLEAVTAEGNTTPLTVEFQNTDTSLVASGNVEVAKELTVTGNATVSSNLTVSGNVVAEYLHGDGSNITGISKTLQEITDYGNVTSNTIQFSNVLTSFVTSSSIDIGGSVQIKNQNQNTLNADISVISPDTTKGAWYGASSWEVSKLTASDAAVDDDFGDRSIDISGDTLVVGAFNEGGSAGAVYVFTRNTTGSGWVERVKLTTSNNVGNGQFGERVRIQDDTIAVSAPSDDSNKGAVYIFTRNTPGDLTSGWTEQYKITGSQSTANDYLSKGLDLYGDTLIVGSYHADNGSGAYGGEAYVFTRTAGNINSSWTERARLVPTIDHGAGDRFGNHISLYEDTVAIGAYGDDGGNATGSFYIFTRTTPGDLTSGWTERQKITAHDAASYDYYGWAISLYENTLMVGAMEENSDKGKVYVYSRTGGSITSSWSHVTDLTASDAYTDDRFGYDLHLEKDVAVISAYRDRHPTGGGVGAWGSGAIYIFERDTPGLSTSSWTQVRKIVPANGGDQDYFGKAVAMDGGTIVVSAPGDDIATDTAGSGQHTNEGSAYVYTANVSGLKLNADHVSITGTHGLAVSGDVEVGTANLFVDTVNSRVGIGATTPLVTLDTHGTMRSSAPYPRLDFYTTTNRSTNAWGNSTDNAGDYRIYSNGDASDGTKRSLNFDYGQNSTHTTRMAINANGFVGIRTASPSFPLSVSDASVKQWNAFDNNTSASDYTFTKSGIYLVGFMYGDGADGNVCEYYTITAATSHGGDCGVTKHKDSIYLNAVAQDHDTVRFWSGSPANALPTGFNSSNFHLRIYFAGYF